MGAIGVAALLGGIKIAAGQQKIKGMRYDAKERGRLSVVIHGVDGAPRIAEPSAAICIVEQSAITWVCLHGGQVAGSAGCFAVLADEAPHDFVDRRRVSYQLDLHAGCGRRGGDRRAIDGDLPIGILLGVMDVCDIVGSVVSIDRGKRCTRNA